MEDLSGPGWVILPRDYLTEHCEYGWASTIDGAQGVPPTWVWCWSGPGWTAITGK